MCNLYTLKMRVNGTSERIVMIIMETIRKRIKNDNLRFEMEMAGLKSDTIVIVKSNICFYLLLISKGRSIEKHTITAWQFCIKCCICFSCITKPIAVGPITDAKSFGPWKFSWSFNTRSDRINTSLPASSTGFIATTNSKLHGIIT